MARDFPFLPLGIVGGTRGVMLATFTFSDGRTSIEEYAGITRRIERLKVETYLSRPLGDFDYRAGQEGMERYGKLLAEERLSLQARLLDLFPLHLRFHREIEAFWKRYEEEVLSVYGKGGPTYLAWKSDIEKLREVTRSSPLLRLAFTPSRGFSLLPFLLSPFLHLGYLQLCAQLFFLWIVAGSLEGQIGRVRLAAAFLLSAYFSAAVGAIAFSGEEVFLIGLSGVLFGLFGLFVAYFGSTPLVIHLGFDDLVLPAYAVIPGYFAIDALTRIAILPHQSYVLPWGGIAAFLLGIVSLLLFGREGGILYRKLSERGGARLSRQERRRLAEQSGEIDQARDLIAQGEVEKGIIRLKTILGNDPQNIPAHQVLFETLLMHGSEEKARLEANKLINKYLILDQRAEALEVYRTFNLHYPEEPLDIPREVLMEPDEAG